MPGRVGGWVGGWPGQLLNLMIAQAQLEPIKFLISSNILSEPFPDRSFETNVSFCSAL